MMGSNWDQMMNWAWGGHMEWGGPLFVLLGVVVLGIIIWGARELAGGSSAAYPPARPTGGGEPTPLEIVQARYARGEISREEFETIRRDLQGAAQAIRIVDSHEDR